MYTRHAVVATSLGQVTIAASGSSITGLYFPQHRYAPSPEQLGDLVEASVDPQISDASQQLLAYLAGDLTEFVLPLATAGDLFQERVWTLLQEIPYGRTTSYGALAEQLGDSTLARRVGQAVGRNPLCVFIPCHRVVGADGALTGYAGGLQRKRQLLDVEAPVPGSADALF
jgi:methylated-DNA-[protein]-cysteine S-methyltransferase